MKSPALFKEYIWLINTIRRAGKISLAEINRKWVDTDMSGGVEFARTTFNRHKDAIEDIFGIFIDCDRRDGHRYYIGNEEVLRDHSIQNWMLNTLSVNNIISESLSLQDRILLESVPSGDSMLTRVIDAMKSKRKIDVEYQRYGIDTPKHYVMAPYCIKLWKQRWYLLGYFYRIPTKETKGLDYFAIFSFDRMLSVSKTEEKFEIYPDFSADSYFNEYYGVLTDQNVAMQKVVIRAYEKERFYLRDLPLHHSQKEIVKGKDYSDFELNLRPTFDFTTQLVSIGAYVKVLEPQWLADEVCHIHRQACALYE